MKTIVKRSSRGFTTVEVLFALTLTSLIYATVFAGLTQFLIYFAKDEASQQLGSDLATAMIRVRNDIRVATQVVPKLGDLKTGDTTLILKQPILDNSGRMVPDEFQHVVYSYSVPLEGVLRQVWPATAEVENETPFQSDILEAVNASVGFLFDGEFASSVEDGTRVRNVDVYLIGGRETGVLLDGVTFFGESGSPGYATLYTTLDYETDIAPPESTLLLNQYVDSKDALKKDVEIQMARTTVALRNRVPIGEP